MNGTENVTVDLDSGLATLSYAGDESILIQAIYAGAGKEAVSAEPEGESRGVTLLVDGMICMKCVGKISKALSEVETDEDIQVSLDTALVTLCFAGENDELIEAVANAGKIAAVVEADHEPMVELSLGSPTVSEHEFIAFSAPEDHSRHTTTQLR